MVTRILPPPPNFQPHTPILCHEIAAKIVTPYAHTQLNTTTHLLVHHDRFREYPFIYVKLHPRVPVCVLIDTGCGGDCAATSAAAINDGAAEERAKRGRYDDLRDFLEEYTIPSLGGPLNPHGERRYLIITTHVHYDHIGGIETLAGVEGAKVVSSGFDRAFIGSEDAKRRHSLVDAVGVRMPQYRVARFVGDGEPLMWPVVGNVDETSETTTAHDVEQGSVFLGLTALHTAGHTPDSLSIYDAEERWLYTGDTFYARACTLPVPWEPEFRQAIIFPREGNWSQFVETLAKLIGFIQGVESAGGKEVEVGCAHTTCCVPGGKLLKEVQAYFERWKRGDVPVKERFEMAGVPGALWEDEGDAQFSVKAPMAIWEG